jgi:hypothetical protein
LRITPGAGSAQQTQHFGRVEAEQQALARAEFAEFEHGHRAFLERGGGGGVAEGVRDDLIDIGRVARGHDGRGAQALQFGVELARMGFGQQRRRRDPLALGDAEFAGDDGGGLAGAGIGAGQEAIGRGIEPGDAAAARRMRSMPFLGVRKRSASAGQSGSARSMAMPWRMR